jgi:endogenous inhibitor of DNA gyrase (YacG/DUF329 family)
MDSLEIEVSCPECGGPVIWLEHQRLNQCSYCSSTLYFEATGNDWFYLPPTAKNQEQIREILVFSKAEKKRAERIARYPGANQEKAEMGSIFEVSLEPFLEEFREKIVLRETRLIYAPYWHLQATLLQCLLSTDRSGGKQYFLRRAFVDETLPAYDTTRWNFRDRGLRFGKVRLKQVTQKFLSESHHIVFLENMHSQLERIAKAHAPLEGESYYLFKFQSLLRKERLPVLRPYWFVLYNCDQQEAALLDGAFGSVAGYPGGVEEAIFLKYQEKPLLRVEPPRIHVISSRCPVCGVDVPWGPHQRIHFCNNCRRALTFRGVEVDCVSYQYAIATTTSMWLPFWRFPVRLRNRNTTFDSLRPFYLQFFPERLLKDSDFRNFLSVPAVNIVQERRGDLLLSALIAEGCRHSDLMQGTLSLQFTIEDCTIGPQEAAEMLPSILPTASGVHPSLHKSGSLVQMLKQTQLETDQGSLVLLPFPFDGDNIRVGKQLFSKNLIQK